MEVKDLGRVEGLSAYEVWLSKGHIGTEEEYLASLKGANGQDGAKGDTGNGIQSITKTGTEGLVDTYTILFTDGTTTTFTVTNGESGASSIIIQAESAVVHSGQTVPELTVEQVTTAYNGFVAGHNVIITDTNGYQNFSVIEAHAISDLIAIYILYNKDMVLCYQINNDEVVISSTAIGGGGSGAVSSVNGKTGEVVLNATDIKLTTNLQTVEANFIRVDETLDVKQDMTDNSLETTNKQIVSAINEVNSLAKQANKAKSFVSYQALITYLNNIGASEFSSGQIFNIQTTNVPDLWVFSVESTSVPYTYTSDADFINATKQIGGQQVGYYKLAQLEILIDLTDYVKNTDYASTTNPGIIRAGAQYGTQVSGMFLQGRTRTYEQYQTDSGTLFVCKGTLENVIEGKKFHSVWTGTQAEFDALTEYEDNTDYQII